MAARSAFDKILRGVRVRCSINVLLDQVGWVLAEAGVVGLLGQAARFAGLALILLGFARDGQERHLSEMAQADGASWGTTWWYVHWPRTWPLVVDAGNRGGEVPVEA